MTFSSERLHRIWLLEVEYEENGILLLFELPLLELNTSITLK